MLINWCVLAKHIKLKEEFHLRRIQYHEGSTRIKYIPNLEEQTEENEELASATNNVFLIYIYIDIFPIYTWISYNNLKDIWWFLSLYHFFKKKLRLRSCLTMGLMFAYVLFLLNFVQIVIASMDVGFLLICLIRD